MIKCSCQLLHFIRKFEPSGRGQRLFHPWSGRKRRAVQIPAHLHPIINFTLSMCFRRTLQASVNC